MKNPFSAAPTLAEVQHLIDDDSLLVPSRKAALNSAINVACKWIGSTPALVPANVEFIRAKLARIEPASVGVTRQRFSTVKSELRFALRHLGLSARGTYLVEMTPAWKALWCRLPCKYSRTAMSRLFRYCSGRHLAPTQISDQVLVDFEKALQTETFVKIPRVARQNACRMWNRLADTTIDWPQVRLTVPRYADHYILPWSAFPANFEADVAAYLANLAHDDILDLNSPPRRLKPRTIKAYHYELRRFASMLVHKGHKPELITSLAYLVEPKHVEDGLRFLLARHGNKPLKAAADLATLLRKVAKHWVRAPQETLAIIGRYAKNVCPPVSGLGLKNRQRLAPLRDEKNLARLFLLPSKVRKEVGARGRPTFELALLLQHAVALSILTFAPIRVGNLSSLHVTRNLRWSAPGMKGLLVIDIDGGDVKNGQTLSFPLPAECADMMRLYLRNYHAHLAGASNPYVFPSDLPGRPKRADTLSTQLSRLIRRSIGLEVNPHLYRHLVHLIVLNRYPGAYAMISRILGHKSLQTAISNYAGEDMAISLRAFQGLVDEVMMGRIPRPSFSQIASGLGTVPNRGGR